MGEEKKLKEILDSAEQNKSRRKSFSGDYLTGQVYDSGYYALRGEALCLNPDLQRATSELEMDKQGLDNIYSLVNYSAESWDEPVLVTREVLEKIGIEKTPHPGTVYFPESDQERSVMLRSYEEILAYDKNPVRKALDSRVEQNNFLIPNSPTCPEKETVEITDAVLVTSPESQIEFREDAIQEYWEERAVEPEIKGAPDYKVLVGGRTTTVFDDETILGLEEAEELDDEDLDETVYWTDRI